MSSSKTIAKNTLFLYIRMCLTMGITLYTSRVILNTLGVNDYGAYSVVGGVVSMFGFFNAAMASATQRFFSFEIGAKSFDKLKQTFSATINIHIGIALLILFLAETIGLWFVNHKLNVDFGRMDAINWVYQFSILSFLVSVMQVPYNALIIARERMNVYAMFSIAEVLLKLGIVYLLVISPYDKLKSYSVLIFGVTFLIAMIYRIYCKRHFSESKYQFHFDSNLYKTLLSYSGWSLFGNIASVARGQGTNMILNIFFGTVVNAAYGITIQVQGAVSVFVRNFQMAVNPQIVKSYAQGNLAQSHKLIFQSSRLSFFLVFVIICPVLFNVDFILHVWLKNPPQYTSIFVRLSLIYLVIDCISGPLMTGAQATGMIKWYQIVIGTFIFLDLPFSYIVVRVFGEPQLAYVVTIVLTVFSLLFRLLFLRKMISFNIMAYTKEVLLRLIFVSALSILIIFFVSDYFPEKNSGLGLIVSAITITIINIVLIASFGVSKSEKKIILSLINEKIFKKNCRRERF